MNRIALSLVSVLLSGIPVNATASAADDQSLAGLDAILAPAFVMADQALAALGQDSSDRYARIVLADVSTQAVGALDAVRPADCFREWHAVVRMAFWLLGRSVAAINAYDAAIQSADMVAASLEESNLRQSLVAGLTLLRWLPAIRAEVTCAATRSPVAPPRRGPASTPGISRYARAI